MDRSTFNDFESVGLGDLLEKGDRSEIDRFEVFACDAGDGGDGGDGAPAGDDQGNDNAGGDFDGGNDGIDI